MSEASSKAVLNELVKIAIRLFYDDKYVIVMDMFTRELVFRDDVLAYRLKLNTKELNRVLARLKDDRLLRVEVRFEKNAMYEFGKALTKSYYYLDYKQLVDVVKYKIFKMRKYFEDRMKSDLEHVGYSCRNCNKIYNSLEVQSMLDQTNFSFRCETCKGELEEHRNERMRNGPQEAHTRLMEQCSLLIELLRKTENIVFPHFDVIRWIESNPDSLSIQMPSSLQSSASDQAVSSKGGLSENADQKEDLKIDIDIRTDDRPSKSVAKEPSFDNSLPLWHRQSTVATSTANKSFDNKEPSIDIPVPRDTQPPVIIAQKYSQIHNATIATNFVPSEISQTANQSSSLQKEVTKQIQEEDDIMIGVCGVPKPFSQITEDDKNRMTEEEYSKYYQIFMETQ